MTTFDFNQLRPSCLALMKAAYPTKAGKALKSASLATGNERDRAISDLRAVVSPRTSEQEWMRMTQAFAQIEQGLVTKHDRDKKISDRLWGSKFQFMFGTVVVDTLHLHRRTNVRLHPAFAILLRPSGGGIGPDNSHYNLKFLRTLAVAFGNDDVAELVDAIEHHASVHDAAGFLKKNWGLGPGYGYAGKDNNPVLDALPSHWFIRGQASGTTFWRDLIDNLND